MTLFVIRTSQLSWDFLSNQSLKLIDIVNVISFAFALSEMSECHMCNDEQNHTNAEPLLLYNVITILPFTFTTFSNSI